MFINKAINCFNKISPVIIQTPWVGTMGNCAEDIYYGLLRARHEKKKVILLYPRDFFWPFVFSKFGTGINKELLKVESDYRIPYDSYLSRAGCWFILLLYCFFKIINVLGHKIFRKRLPSSYLVPEVGRFELWNPENLHRFSREKVRHSDWGEQTHTYLSVDLPDKSCRKGEQLLREMGVPENDWFVCLHIREPGYYEREGKLKSIRNSTVGNYKKMIQLVTSAGGWVVRLGDATMTPLPRMERVIDYPHTRYKNDLMDIYLIKACRFFIGANSGPWQVAFLFQKPMVTVNTVEFVYAYPRRRGDVGLIKHVYSRSKNRFLSLEESLGVITEVSFFLPNDENFEFHENTPEEIHDIVKEFMQQVNQNGNMDLQNEYERRREAEVYNILENCILDKDPEIDVNMKYLISAHVDGPRGALGRAFLELNWAISSMNTKRQSTNGLSVDN